MIYSSSLNVCLVMSLFVCCSNVIRECSSSWFCHRLFSSPAVLYIFTWWQTLKLNYIKHGIMNFCRFEWHYLGSLACLICFVLVVVAFSLIPLVNSFTYCSLSTYTYFRGASLVAIVSSYVCSTFIQMVSKECFTFTNFEVQIITFVIVY